MFDFTSEQQQAVSILDRPLVVTAAAGSGKTAVLVSRYIELLKKGLRPHEILTLTFTTDAAEELKNRILVLLKHQDFSTESQLEVLRTRFIGTIHSFCFYLVNEFGSLLSLPSIENILTEYEQQLAFAENYQLWLKSLSPQNLENLLSFFPQRELRPLVLRLYETRFLLAESLALGPLPEALGLLYHSVEPFLLKMEKQFHSQGLYHFSDLESLSLKLVREAPEVQRRIQKQFKALLIDEFQDTSRIQWDILKHLLGSDTKKLFVVGDPKQSIYAFRHADVSLFQELSLQIQSSGGVLCELNTNFRTHSALLENINQLSTGLFQGTSMPFHFMTAGEREIGVSATVLHYEGEDSATRTQMEKEKTLDRVEELLNQGAQAKDIALLFRMGDRIEAYASALKSREIQTQCTKTLSLFQHYDVLDIANFLRALHNPLDDFTLASFLVSPYVGFHPEELLEFCEPKGIALFEKMLSRKPDTLKWFAALAEKKHSSVHEALQALFENSNYFPQAGNAFWEILSPLSERPLSLSEAISAMDLWEREGIAFKSHLAPASGNAVHLMTVHGAKGLEFPHVLLVDNLRQPHRASDNFLIRPNMKPGIRYLQSGESVCTPEYEELKKLNEELDAEESRRILYVALTRAKESLTLFLPQHMKGVSKGSWADLLSGGRDNTSSSK